MDGEPAEDATLFPTTVGEKLREARQAQNLELADIAARTRIPQRHLEAIEESSYSGLPSITYALGFAKAYARTVGVDEVAIARDLRAELDRTYHREPPSQPYEMTDPTRTPPSGLVWAGVAVAAIVLIGVVLFYTTDWFRGSTPPAETLAVPTEVATEGSAAQAPQPTPTAVAATGGQVALIATDTVWLRVNDASGNRLYESELQAGDRYDIPADADAPVVKTGRADQLRVTLNGSDLGPLGPPERTVELGIGADAVRARQAQPDTEAAP